MRPLIVLLTCLSLAVHAGDGVAGDPDYLGQTLQGVRAVTVRVDGVHPDFARYGVVGDALRLRVEERLRAAGIVVVDAGNAETARSTPVLAIDFTVHDHTNDYFNHYPYLVSLKLKQKVPLPNAADAFIAATVWSDGRSGIEAPLRLSRLNDYVLTLVDHFIADLNAQNRS
ncbi:MAG: hypothetical protein IT495_06350 [Gammaproteobacteria bacterium]|nr:hypothetical protein [Gammaproteobacteria bacterium]